MQGGFLTAVCYVGEVLRQQVIPISSEFIPDFILMPDYAHPHTAGIVTTFSEENNTTVLSWPSRCLDENPIEHVWDLLGRRLSGRQSVPEYLEELEKALWKSDIT